MIKRNSFRSYLTDEYSKILIERKGKVRNILDFNESLKEIDNEAYKTIKDVQTKLEIEQIKNVEQKLIEKEIEKSKENPLSLPQITNGYLVNKSIDNTSRVRSYSQEKFVKNNKKSSFISNRHSKSMHDLMEIREKFKIKKVYNNENNSKITEKDVNLSNKLNPEYFDNKKVNNKYFHLKNINKKFKLKIMHEKMTNKGNYNLENTKKIKHEFDYGYEFLPDKPNDYMAKLLDPKCFAQRNKLILSKIKKGINF